MKSAKIFVLHVCQENINKNLVKNCAYLATEANMLRTSKQQHVWSVHSEEIRMRKRDNPYAQVVLLENINQRAPSMKLRTNALGVLREHLLLLVPLSVKIALLDFIKMKRINEGANLVHPDVGPTSTEPITRMTVASVLLVNICQELDHFRVTNASIVHLESTAKNKVQRTIQSAKIAQQGSILRVERTLANHVIVAKYNRNQTWLTVLCVVLAKLVAMELCATIALPGSFEKLVAMVAMVGSLVVTHAQQAFHNQRHDKQVVSRAYQASTKTKGAR